jgi:hypothetical protein
LFLLIISLIGIPVALLLAPVLIIFIFLSLPVNLVVVINFELAP